MSYGYNLADVSDAVKKSYSFANVLRLLNKKQSSGSQTCIRRFMVNNRIDFSHFTGQIHRTPQAKKSFESGSKKVSTHLLKKRLLRDGILNPVCNRCGISEWNGSKAPLELHHKDGDRNNNSISNLEILCPNCHAQTDGYCKKRGYK